MASSSRSIGSLFIDIEARTAKLETDMAKAKRIIDQSTTSVKGMSDATTKLRDHQNVMLNQLTQRLAGMLALFTVMKTEIAHVWNNIEKIPGIPPQTVASIQAAKQNMAEFRQTVDGFIAAGIAGFLDFGKAIGHALATGGQGFDESAYDMVAAEVAHRNKVTDAGKIIELEKKLRDQKRETNLAGMRNVDQIKELLRYAGELDKLSGPKGFGGVRADQLKAQVESADLRAKANEKIKNINEQVLTSERRLAMAEDEQSMALLSKTESVEKLRAKLQELNSLRPAKYVAGPMVDGITTMVKKELTPEEKEQDIRITDKMTAAQYRLNSAIRAAGELARDMGNAMAASLGDAILSGEKLSSVLDKLMGVLLQIILQRTVLEPLANMFTGGLNSLFSLGKHAMGGPISGATLVGENGPELLLGSSSGTVIPNEQLGGRGGRGNTYYIDASGADTAAVSRLESMLIALAGPGVVERRSLSATMNASRRRGSNGSIFQGA